MGAMPAPDEDAGWWSYTMLCGSLGVIALGTGMKISKSVALHGYNAPLPAIPWRKNPVSRQYAHCYSVCEGGIKPNVSSFGADQFNDADPQDRREKESFFNYFYLAINVGSLIAVTVIVYIQDSVSWTLGFAIPGGGSGAAHERLFKSSLFKLTTTIIYQMPLPCL